MAKKKGPKPETQAYKTLARNAKGGATVMTGTASEIADEVEKVRLENKKTPQDRRPDCVTTCR
jgi:hypothetical protein